MKTLAIDIFLIIAFVFAMLFLVRHQKIEQQISCQHKCGVNPFYMKMVQKKYLLCVCENKTPGNYKIFDSNENEEK